VELPGRGLRVDRLLPMNVATRNRLVGRIVDEYVAAFDME
jgi:hypothetical protein